MSLHLCKNCFAKVSLLTLEGLLNTSANPLVFSNLVIACMQRELISIAQSNASSTISFFVFCDGRKKYLTICDQILRHRGKVPISLLLNWLLQFFGRFKAY